MDVVEREREKVKEREKEACFRSPNVARVLQDIEVMMTCLTSLWRLGIPGRVRYVLRDT